ncbi:tRNA 2-thiouridine(34) synthase MnmA [Simkania negevensis]|uniref:tRNA-specific 2-thiouridylase MnmA n=1 Tax=Simkania negevensis TaxID=83561 RepID=A0ABS3AQU5_9BACT|nr:tRNA 2-thiouridine(34) synthase MnmA [Simkania negevensis]
MVRQKKKRVVVGMSGGVDSSLTAKLLKDDGYEVIGLFMRNWDETSHGGECRATQDSHDAQTVCDQIGIPFYVVNFTQGYWDRVFATFLKELKQGYTPNPDVLCNREIKFDLFYQKALSFDADYLATGHYARVIQRNGRHLLAKGVDSTKDQSYFLHAINGRVLEKVLFPLGEMKKKEVRKISSGLGLVTSDKRDSMGICFIGKRNFKDFLGHYLGYSRGEFRRLSGEVVGEHDGSAYYTIGQRKGLGLGGAGEAWFVVGKEKSRNVVYVEQGQDHPALYSRRLVAHEATWICGDLLENGLTNPAHLTAKIRYRQSDEACMVKLCAGGVVEVEFTRPQRAVTARQSVVFYDGEICLGGAWIESADTLAPLR